MLFQKSNKVLKLAQIFQFQPQNPQNALIYAGFAELAVFHGLSYCLDGAGMSLTPSRISTPASSARTQRSPSLQAESAPISSRR